MPKARLRPCAATPLTRSAGPTSAGRPCRGRDSERARDPLTIGRPSAWRRFSGMAEPVGRPPRVAMVVNNGIVNDARVLKSAQSLARAGAQVVVLGVASPGAG